MPVAHAAGIFALSNAHVDFEISDSDMGVLRAAEHSDYGQAAVFPVYGGKLR